MFASKEKRSLNKTVMIVAKNEKDYFDILRYLYHVFVVKDEGRGFHDERLRQHLSSFKERARRDVVLERAKAFSSFDHTKGDLGAYVAKAQEGFEPPEMLECSKHIVETHLLYKLSLFLDYKYEYATQSKATVMSLE